jgi:spiro-SPASM protein
LELIKAVLDKPGLSLVLETCGFGWTDADFEAIAALKRRPLAWIVSLDPGVMPPVKGPPAVGPSLQTALSLFRLFPQNTYVQAVRMKGNEEQIEKFYRAWIAEPLNTRSGEAVIIQKYDDFCGFFPKRQASDLSPVERQPCWHLQRDMNILVDGQVSRCREAVCPIGNAFNENLAEIWQNFNLNEEKSPCGVCDEYYTFNF